MALREYIRLLDEENRVRVKFETERSVVVKFTVQYESLVGNDWRAIVRYDTSHGFAHRDILMPGGSQRKDSFDLGDFGSALSYSQEDLFMNWENYKETYLRRMKK